MKSTILTVALAVALALGLMAPAFAGGQGKSGKSQAAASTGKYVMDGTAEVVREPDVRPTNHVLQIDTTETYGSMSRQLGVAPESLDGALSFDYYIESGDCGGGAPRLILSVDNDADGTHDFWLLTDGSGSPGWEACPSADGAWESFDGTDDADTYWRIHPGGGYMTWSEAKAALNDDAVILSGALVDDGFWKDGVAGVAYYDNVAIGDRTFTGPQDVLGN